jgi:hypothetical protein
MTDGGEGDLSFLFHAPQKCAFKQLLAEGVPNLDRQGGLLPVQGAVGSQSAVSCALRYQLSMPQAGKSCLTISS